MANSDGGFADRPEWLSNPSATYFTLDALAALDALSVLRNTGGTPIRRRDPIPANLKVFSIQIEAHGQGSPSEAVELAGALKIDLWGGHRARQCDCLRALCVRALCALWQKILREECD